MRIIRLLLSVFSIFSFIVPSLLVGTISPVQAAPRPPTDFSVPQTSGRFQPQRKTSIAQNEYQEPFSSIPNQSQLSELIFSTFLGAELADMGEDIAIDSAGNIYVLLNSYDETSAPYNTAIDVVKLNPNGTDILYTTDISTGEYDYGHSIAVDRAGNVYIAGSTSSTSFIPPGSLDDTLDGVSDAFVIKLDVNGDVEYGTYLGGNDMDGGLDLAVDGDGNIYVTGFTQSSDFPVTPGSYDEQCGTDVAGNCNYSSGMRYPDVFVAKINNTGSVLEYATFIGGENSDAGQSIVLGNSGEVYVTGNTYSNSFPTTVGALDRSCGLSGDCTEMVSDVFVTKLNASGTDLDYATYWGYDGSESGNGIVVDRLGQAYVVGRVDYFGASCSPVQCTEGFLFKLNDTGTDLVYELPLGASQSYPLGVSIDDEDNIYVVGATNSSSFPLTPDAIQSTNGGGVCGLDDPCLDVFMARLEPNGTINYATLLGGNHFDTAFDITVGTDSVYLTGTTSSENFPTTSGVVQEDMDSTICGWDPDFHPCGDAFVTRLAIDLLPITKSAPLTATIGSQIPYTLTLANHTGITLTNVVITDTIPANAHYLFGGTQIGNVISWSIPSMAAGTITHTNFVVTATQTITNSNYRVSAVGGYSTTGTISVTTVVQEALITGLTIENNSPTPLGQPTTLTATIISGDNITYTLTYGDGSIDLDAGPIVTHTYPAIGHYTAEILASNSRNQITATTPITITGEPYLTISKTAPVTVAAGSRITYTLTTTNTGTADATNLIITDAIPVGAVYITGGTKVGNVVSWAIPSLVANGGVTQATFVVTATQTITNNDYGISASGGYRITGNIEAVTVIDTKTINLVYFPIVLKN